MEELMRTNDIVLLSFAESLLHEAGILAIVFDQNMSVLEGSLGIIAKRLMVESDRADEARDLLREAGVGSELRPRLS